MTRSANSERDFLRFAVAGAMMLVIGGAVLAGINERVYRLRAVEQLHVQAQILAAGVGAALAFDDTKTIREYVDALSANPEVAVAGVYDDGGRLVVQYQRAGAAPPPARPPSPSSTYRLSGVVAVEPVAEKGARLGSVYLRTISEPIGRTGRRHASFLFLLVMALFVTAALARATRELQRRAADLAQANRTLVLEMAERAKVEEALRQSQKMEALGQLTGGVAHDFNNLLTVIMGGLETIGRQLPKAGGDADSARLHRARDAAMQGAERAAALTKRLLAFSRRQPLKPDVIDANTLVSGMVELMRRTLGETIALKTVLGADLWRAEVDPGQLESALLNLALNASDAMPEGGKLTIETANSALDEAYVDPSLEPAPPGQYVLIAVTDTGCGMDAETLEHVFEPFFTTKEVGKGTGLGLSQVYGFVRQSGGYVRIDSEPGRGASVKIYLPRALADESCEDSGARTDPGTLAGEEAILIVEDHDDLRAYSEGVLAELGYRTFVAATGREGLALIDAHPELAMLFTDVVLPGGMNGRQLADEALRRRPGLKVLFTTGYSRNAIVHNGALDPGVQLISKPFTYRELAAKVRRILDSAD